ncbi:sugar phosphate nucleotidyltransferase, partial [Patescibacteria group bacterium AH-259-L07]|nr:sugar phosphate nucleotidyltransferase [Patescibacteria group bacterium AH-259-L07]
KQLLNVWDRPLIYYPLQTLVNAGIKEILIVTGGNNPGDFLRLLGNGKEFGLKELHYTYQERAGGIAEAVGLAEDFADEGKVVVILGDNIFEDDITPAVKDFMTQPMGAKLFLKKVVHPERFGVAEVKGKKVINIEEKPKKPKSQYAVTGLYMYGEQVFDVIKTLKPSRRGELEITDVNNFYIKQGTATFEFVKGFWSDAGTFESLLRASNLVAKKAKQG